MTPAFLAMPSAGLWKIADHLYSLSLSPEHTIFVSPRNNGLVVLNSFASSILSLFTSPLAMDSDLFNPGIFSTVRQFAALGLLVPVEGDFPCLSSKENCNSDGTFSSPLVAWLHLTDRCNLRCLYCYLPHVRQDMSGEIGRAAIDATFRSAIANGFKRVKLKYAGGEPLLRFPLSVELHTYAQRLADKHGLGLEGVILSNGTLLTPDIVKMLKSLDLRLMISLDGLKKFHDNHRPYAGGRGSFEDVAEAVDLALTNGLIPNISVTISSRTVEGLPQLIGWTLRRDLPFSLNFYRENDLATSYEDMRLDEQRIISGMLAGFEVIEKHLPRHPFLSGVIDRANLAVAHTHTCGVGQNYLVFDQNGQVAKCQMQIRRPITNIDVVDPLNVVYADQTGIQNLSVDKKEDCRTCEWKFWCAGGCPLATYRETGRYDAKSPNCNIYKALFSEALRLEGLRLLKYQDEPEIVTKFQYMA